MFGIFHCHLTLALRGEYAWLLHDCVRTYMYKYGLIRQLRLMQKRHTISPPTLTVAYINTYTYFAFLRLAGGTEPHVRCYDGNGFYMTQRYGDDMFVNLNRRIGTPEIQHSVRVVNF